jgi:hypothetical protein
MSLAEQHWQDSKVLKAATWWFAAFCYVRPAWAHSCGYKSRRKLITANEVKRNRVRVTERGKEAWIEMRADGQEPDTRRCRVGRAGI